MIFSSHPFIFLFLPIVWLGYFGLHRAGRHGAAKCFLVGASFAFYAFGSGDFVLVFMASVAVNFVIGTRLARQGGDCAAGGGDTAGRRRIARAALLALGILQNVALLGYYKYSDFLIKNVNRLFRTDFPLPGITLPIGISFFTFQLIAYLVDSYRGLTKGYRFLDYLLFITFFPQLIVGPIVHHGEVVPQFEEQENQRVNWNNVAKGLFVFSIGVAKKILLADPLTQNAQVFFDHGIDSASALCTWWYAAEYTVSYYFDLSGYADMAIGIALMFNVTLPENFNSPYKARNFQDYWQRWHITLSRFLGAYVFRSVYRRDSRWRNYYVATMVTFLVSGFWHGAGWHFVLWGMVNGTLVCAASWMKRRGLSLNAVLAHALTLLGIVLTRILFVCPLRKTLTVLRCLVNFSSVESPAADGFFYALLLRMAVALVVLFALPPTREFAERFTPGWRRLVPTALGAGLSVAFMGRVAVFLYFQF